MKRILLISLLVCLAALTAAEPRKPDCRPYLGSACQDQSQPVCGADGQTYPNECTLCKQMDNDNKVIMLVNDGQCA